MIESELKIPVDGLDAVRDRLGTHDARPIAPMEHERNVLFDTDDGRLKANGEVLRIRRTGDRRLVTFKGPASFDGAVKNRREIELEVSSASRLTELLEALGYRSTMRYEKRRESWLLGAVRVELDRTPMGDFVELEGPPAELADAARRLGLDPADAVAGSYVRLWEEHRKRHPGLGRDMVFEP